MHVTANGRQEAALRRSMGPMPVRRQVIPSGDVRKVVGESRSTGLSIKTAEKMTEGWRQCAHPLASHIVRVHRMHVQ